MNVLHRDTAFQQDWAQYYQAVDGRPPRETLLAALALAKADVDPSTAPFAVDLGCGNGRDTLELLRQGWHVLAIDGEPAAIAQLQKAAANLWPHHPERVASALDTRVAPFETLTLPPSVDLINASFCLPFCPPDTFPALWQTIVATLRVGGRFCGQLFGDRDSWASYPNLTHHTRVDVERLLQPFAVEFWVEEEHPGQTALGAAKHWHLFQVVAQKQR